MKLIAKHIVPDNITDIRIYDYCLALFVQLPSRKSVKKAIDNGEILVNENSVKTGYWLKGGEELSLVDREKTPPKTYHKKLDILYEDSHLAVIYKPAGLLVSGNQFKTVTNALAYNLNPSEEVDALPWALPVHRLDKATSGLLLIAKTKKCRMLLGQQFEEGRIQKQYHAVVLGELKGKGKFNTPIDGKAAQSLFESISSYPSLRSEHLTLLKLFPKTGRTHQLRKHLAENGHAILGDPLYSPENLQLKHKGLFLSATRLKFKHPVTKKEVKIEVDPPKKFMKRLESELKRWKSAYLD
jgi:RluA family pseudouridine synthase